MQARIGLSRVTKRHVFRYVPVTGRSHSAPILLAGIAVRDFTTGRSPRAFRPRPLPQPSHRLRAASSSAASTSTSEHPHSAKRGSGRALRRALIIAGVAGLGWISFQEVQPVRHAVFAIIRSTRVAVSEFWRTPKPHELIIILNRQLLAYAR